MAIVQFVPEIWAPLILDNLRNKLVYGSAGIVNRNYEGEIAQAGDTVHITSFTDPAVRAYTKNTDITYDLLTDATRALNVDQSDYFAFTVDDVDRRQAMAGFVAKASAGAAHNLAADTDTFLSTTMAAGVSGSAPDNTLGAKTVNSADSAYNLLVLFRQTLVKANVPAGQWFIVIPPEYYSYLLKDARFIDASASADGGAALRNGFVGRAAGFDIYESNTVPEATGVWTVIAGHPMATTFAEQINSVEALRLEDQFGDAIRGLHLYGAKVVYPAALASAEVTVS